jgi:peptidoglycan hydrolase-like protein with peptidoglycan-binding domain
MPKITIYESVGSTSQLVTNYQDLENHHPSRRLQESGRVYARVGGESEEILGNYRGTAVLTPGGNYMVSKDMVLTAPGLANNQVAIPSPAAGVIGRIDRDDGVITINDPATGDTMFQIRHARIDPNLKAGDSIAYGQPIGHQDGYNNGNANAFPDHVHFDVNTRYIAQADKWVRDMHSGALTTDTRPAQAENLVTERPSFVPISGSFPQPADPPLADGKLSYGEQGPEVERLQRALLAANIRDAAGQPLDPDQDFGRRTREAVENYQRQNNQPVTGVADQQMLTALGVIQPTQQQPTQQQPTQQQPTQQQPTQQQPTQQPTQQQPTQQQPTQQQPVQPAAQTNPYGFGPDNELGRLIGSGEGGYNSYNRGVAGDARGAQIDFSQMTVGEIMRRQDLPAGDPDRLFAVGKYQFTPNTLEEAINQTGVDRNARFTPQLQEKLFADYLIDEKRPSVRAYVTGEATGPQALERAQHALAQEFASVGTPRNGGRGAYDGDSAGNMASITTAETATALNNMRDQYQRNIQSGMQPEQAYRALSGDPNNFARDAGAVQRGGGLDDRELTHGERGDGVRRLQEALNGANIRDAQDKPLPTTGYYGDMTQAAVRQYQEREGLPVTGRAGPETLTALGILPAQQQNQSPAEQQPTQQQPTQQQPTQQQPTQQQPTQQQPTQQQPTQQQPTQQQPTQQQPAESSQQPPVLPQPSQTDRPLISNPNHPDHRLYQQAVSNLEQLGPSGGFASREALEKAAAAVAADAKASGLSDITHVSRTQGSNGQGFLVAVQGDPTNPASKNAYVDYNQAVNQTVEQSSRMAEANKPVQDPQPAQQQEQNRMAMGAR